MMQVDAHKKLLLVQLLAHGKVSYDGASSPALLLGALAPS